MGLQSLLVAKAGTALVPIPSVGQALGDGRAEERAWLFQLPRRKDPF